MTQLQIVTRKGSLTTKGALFRSTQAVATRRLISIGGNDGVILPGTSSRRSSPASTAYLIECALFRYTYADYRERIVEQRRWCGS